MFKIELTGVPITSTLYFFNTPFSASSTPTLRAVCPPKLRRIPSGRSFAITFSTKSNSIGTK